MISANGRGAPGVAAVGPPGGRAAAVGSAAAGVPATVALVADDAGAPTGVLGDGVAAAVVAGGLTVAHDESIAATATNKTERADSAVRESTAM